MSRIPSTLLVSLNCSYSCPFANSPKHACRTMARSLPHIQRLHQRSNQVNLLVPLTRGVHFVIFPLLRVSTTRMLPLVPVLSPQNSPTFVSCAECSRYILKLLRVCPFIPNNNNNLGSLSYCMQRLVVYYLRLASDWHPPAPGTSSPT